MHQTLHRPRARENLGDLVKHSNGKYELSSIGTAAVDLMSGVEERPQILIPTSKLRGKKIRNALMGAVLFTLVISAALNIYFFNSSQELTERIQGATLETAQGFEQSLRYATFALESLESEAERANASLSYNISAHARYNMSAVSYDNAKTLIRHFLWHTYSARYFISTFRLYLLPSYGDSHLTVENLLLNMSVAGRKGLSDTLNYLKSMWWKNTSMVAGAFKELNLAASEKIREMGHELPRAFECVRRFTGDMKRLIGIESLRIDHSRLENIVPLANELNMILNEWGAKYS